MHDIHPAQTDHTADKQAAVEKAAGIFKLLSHPSRLQICCQLRYGEMSVGDMETTLGIRQPGLSKELAKLRDGGFVASRRQSKVVFYKLASKKIHDLVTSLCRLTIEQEEEPAQSETPQHRPGGYGLFPRVSPSTAETSTPDDRRER